MLVAVACVREVLVGVGNWLMIVWVAMPDSRRHWRVMPVAVMTIVVGMAMLMQLGGVAVPVPMALA